MRIVTRLYELSDRALEMVAYYKYVYGMKYSYGVLTESRLNTLAKDNPSVYTANYINKARAYIGKKVIDCSGLVCYLWGISDIGSWDISQLYKTKPDKYEKVSLDKLLVGDCLWKQGHVGIYLGENKVLEAKGINYGVRISEVSETPWVYAIRDKELIFYGRIGWCKTNDKWWYTYGVSKGEYLHDCTVTIDNKAYSFDSEGWLIEK